MSEKKDISRAELVRLRREKDSRTRVERARKESTRSVPVTSRTRTGRSAAAIQAGGAHTCAILDTGARWQDIPVDLPSGSTCWRRCWCASWGLSGAG